MKIIGYLIQKEFLQIIRNKGILPILLVLPVIQLLVLAYAADFEIRNLRIFWVDQDQSAESRLLRGKFEHSEFFHIVDYGFSIDEGEEVLNRGETDIVVIIPNQFQKHLMREGSGDILLNINAINGTKAGLGSYYASQIIGDFNLEIGRKTVVFNTQNYVTVDATYSFWFNPYQNYKTFMVPGILVLLVTMIGAFVASMNIVREKELGTIEQLNVTPIKKYQFIAGKLIPLWIIGLLEFTIGLIVARLVFSIPVVGSLWLLYGFTAIYLIMIPGMGMFISTVTDTQQQAMFVTWFFLVIFILMSGLFTPIENMPEWAQKITLVNPIRYFIEVIRMVMLKGATLDKVHTQLLIITVYGLVINGLAIWRYRKVS
ncbi:ABC transporter permease [Ekhidna sp.]|jgi:ABC-2 type transport system permease protein|uniref:ABC transporter permease n=1 Tax=Ekhidna sp. TaxID=2608089 RepID=UPI0032EBCC66